GQHRPRLHDGVNAALVVEVRAERRAVVEPGPQIPVAVPGVLLDRVAQPFGLGQPAVRPLGIAAGTGQIGKGTQTGDQEPADPDALALATGADAVHAVVPVAGAHQRQAVRTEAQAVLQSANAVLVQAPVLAGPLRQTVIVLALRRQLRPGQERHAL